MAATRSQTFKLNKKLDNLAKCPSCLPPNTKIVTKFFIRIRRNPNTESGFELVKSYSKDVLVSKDYKQ